MYEALLTLESNLTPNLKEAFSKGIENASEPIYKVLFIVFICLIIYAIYCIIKRAVRNIFNSTKNRNTNSRRSKKR